MSANISLISELEDALKNGSSNKRLETLRRVTNLFLDEADRLNDHQIGVFDDVLGHLVRRIESKALVELSQSLAPVENAPLEVIRRLARDDEIAVAGPVLAQSSRLEESDLVDIARMKSQGHLLAISSRSSLTESVTDVLVERGDHPVVHRLAENSGARFSNLGFCTLVDRALGDDALAQKVGVRLDIPIKLLRELLLRATDLVRSRLLSSVSAEKRDQMQQALAGIAVEVAREVAGPRNYEQAETLVQELNRQGKLNEQVLLNFAQNRRYEEMVATLALFCGAPVTFLERIIKTLEPEALLMACKAAKLSWTPVSEILKARFGHHLISNHDLTAARTSFLALSQPVAQRTLRFMLAQSAAKDGTGTDKTASIS